ncbi:MAG: phosphatidylserine decarboxylase [Gammaproteobacteria bacterium]|nr:MAG: phosphatidylserine decarboxylase [Gammaproteobacteria bacterium]
MPPASDDAARKRISDYSSLLDFFTRELSPDARPTAGKDDNNIIVCPVDGCVAHVGNISEGQIFQIKGHSYALTDLVGQDYAATYHNGQAATIYLAPYDYHRIHLPMNGKLSRARYIPGELNSVSITLLDKIAGLFAKNERVVLEFISDNGQPFLMVLVGAVNVGSIATVFHGEICPNRYAAAIDLDCHNEHLHKGEELGRFNLGSTIIFITPANHHIWQLHAEQKTKVGQTIARLTDKIQAKAND